MCVPVCTPPFHGLYVIADTLSATRYRRKTRSGVLLRLCFRIRLCQEKESIRLRITYDGRALCLVMIQIRGNKGKTSYTSMRMSYHRFCST